MHAINEYNKLNDHVKKQLDILNPIYHNHHEVRKTINSLKKNEHISDDNKKKLINYAIFTTFTTRDLMIHDTSSLLLFKR